MKKIILILIIIITLTGCGKTTKESETINQEVKNETIDNSNADTNKKIIEKELEIYIKDKNIKSKNEITKYKTVKEIVDSASDIENELESNIKKNIPDNFLKPIQSEYDFYILIIGDRNAGFDINIQCSKEDPFLEDRENKKYIEENKEENSFITMKNKCLKLAEDFEVSDENTLFSFDNIESSFFELKKMKDWNADNNNLTKFVQGVSYFYKNFEDDTLGKEIREKGWNAIESLYFKKEDFEKTMDEFKEIYKLSGRNLFENKYESGQYKVGTDMEPGEYVFFANSSRGYFCVSSDANGNDIISNENFSYNSIMTVCDGEYLELSRCYAVPISEVTELPIDKANMFKIGVHIPAGEYKLISDGAMGYYCIYSDNRQDDIESNDNFNGQSYILVSDGQYLELSRCHIEEN